MLGNGLMVRLFELMVVMSEFLLGSEGNNAKEVCFKRKTLCPTLVG